MLKKRIIVLPKGRLFVKEWKDAYKYLYVEAKDNRWVKRRRWEKHMGYEGNRPHIHYYDEFGFSDKFQKRFSVNYGLKKVLKEIKNDFDASIDVGAALLEAGEGD